MTTGTKPELITVEQHGMNYRPLIPHPKIVLTRGAVNQTAVVIIWLRWVVNIELPCPK